MLEVNERYNEIVEDLRNRNKTKKGNYTTAEIRGIANDILRASDIDIQSYRYSIPIVKISGNLGIEVYYSRNIDVSGKILLNDDTIERNCGERQVILINKKYSLYPARFITAYLLGYFLFNYLGSKYDEEMSVYEGEYQYLDYFSKKQDSQIGIFTEEILMPKNMFCEQYFKGSEFFRDEQRRLWDIAIKKYLSRYFEVEVSLVKKRIYQLK